MIEGLDYWTPEQMEKGCAILQDLEGSELEPDDCHLFVHIPYERFRCDRDVLYRFVETRTCMLGLYLVRVDLSTTRHVLFGFLDAADRDRLLEVDGLITRQPDPGRRYD